MFRFQYSVVTNAAPELAWEIFSDHSRWNNFVGIYGNVCWREGAPWRPGSRMEIEILQPVYAVIEHVITSCVPAKRVGWIDHALGAAMAQWVTFESLPSGVGTRIHTWGDLVHAGQAIGGWGAEHLITSFTKVWYENFRIFCNQIAQGAALPDVSPLSFPKAPQI